MKRTIHFFLLAALFLLACKETAFATAMPDLTVACDTCHFCSAPLGICIFVWAVIICLVLLILASLIRSKKRCPVCQEKCNKRAKACPYCKYDFLTGELPGIARTTPPQEAAPAPQIQQNKERIVPPTISSQTQQTQHIVSPQKTMPQQEHAAQFCPHCGKPLPQNARFCSGCGSRL